MRLDALMPKRRYRPGPHLIEVIEQEAPGVFEIRCACGAQTWTPWGIEHAAEIGGLHLWSVGIAKTIVPLS